MSRKSSKTERRYQSLRGRLIQRGYTLRSFALAHHYSVPTVYLAARGLRAGVESIKIRKHLEEMTA